MPPSNEELPRAYVLPGLSTDVSITEQEVVEFASKRLARYKRLSGGVRFVKALLRRLARPRREYYGGKLKPRYVRVGQRFKSSA